MKIEIINSAPPHQGEPVSIIVEMEQCPAVGEQIAFDDVSEATVKSVVWMIDSIECDVRIRCR